MWWNSAQTEGLVDDSAAPVSRQRNTKLHHPHCCVLSCMGPIQLRHFTPLHIRQVSPLGRYQPTQDCCCPSLPGQPWKCHSFQTTGLLDGPSFIFCLILFFFFLSLFLPLSLIHSFILPFISSIYAVFPYIYIDLFCIFLSLGNICAISTQKCFWREALCTVNII